MTSGIDGVGLIDLEWDLFMSRRSEGSHFELNGGRCSLSEIRVGELYSLRW